MSELDSATLAVKQIFQIPDSEWSDRLIELLRHADMESFRTKLLTEHKRRWDDFDLKFPGERERSNREFAEREAKAIKLPPPSNDK